MPLLDVKHDIQAISIPVAHFFILFGYKLFSLYFPLFLIEKNFSFSEIGYAYLLIYGTIALSSPLLRMIFTKRDAAKLIQLGFLGYILYSVGMIFSEDIIEIYLWQIFLGISSATFYISSRFIISESKKVTEEFSYFYLTPFLVSFLAPFIGGILLLFFGFNGIFKISILVYILGMVVTKKLIKGVYKIHKRKGEIKLLKSAICANKLIFFVLAIALISIGIYRSFFVVFLEEYIKLSKDKIVLFVTTGALLVSLISLKSTNFTRRNEKNDIYLGNFLSGISSMIIAVSQSIAVLFALFLCENIGRWLSQTGKSGFLVKSIKRDKEMTAVFDTIFTSLFVALGSVCGGVIAEYFGIKFLFFFIGILLILSSLAMKSRAV